MDYLTFSSEVIKSLSWPVCAIIIIFLIRKPIFDLIPYIKKLKYKELELEFSKEIANMKAEFQETKKTTASTVSDNNRSTLKNILQLAEFSPRSAITEAWIEVEKSATEVASSFWSQSSTEVFRKHPQLGEYLFQCKVIDKNQLVVFNKLKSLRNKAVHAEALEISKSDVKNYVELAFELSEQIKSH